MKNVIVTAKKGRENGRPLAIENVDKTAMAEVAKVSSAINLGNKYSQIISNADIDTARYLRPTGIKKYWKCASQIQDKIDELHKDWILILRVFIKHSWRMYDNKEVIKNMMIRHKIDPEQALSLFVQLHKSIYCQKMEDKNIADATKLVN